jgi:hypothetical protein
MTPPTAPSPSAGREMDERIAEVMGGDISRGVAHHDSAKMAWAVYRGPGEIVGGGIPPFSADIAAAWTMVEALRERGVFIDVETTSERYRACAGREGGDNEDIWVLTDWFSADTAPLAICRAALAALSGDSQ